MTTATTTSPAPPVMRRGERDYPFIARAGWPIIAWIALGSIVAGLLAWFGAGPVAAGLVGAAGIAVTGWSFWFFRDPVRSTPAEPGLVVASADGVVCFVGADRPPAELGLSDDITTGMTRVSVFMNIFNVHVNRIPTQGRVTAITYRAGKFFNAARDKASIHNERCALTLALPGGGVMVVAQIAGLVARRIVCSAAVGQEFRAGERFGIIRFGSRVDVYLPPGVSPKVEVGQRSIAGETILAQLPSGAGDAA